MPAEKTLVCAFTGDNVITVPLFRLLETEMCLLNSFCGTSSGYWLGFPHHQAFVVKQHDSSVMSLLPILLGNVCSRND